MSQAVKTITPSAPQLDLRRPAIMNFLPALLPIVGAIVMLMARRQMGYGNFIDDGALLVIALLCYIFAAAMHLTDLFAPIPGIQKVAVWTASLGFFFNLSSWLVRWVNMGDKENWTRMTDHEGVYHAWWFFSYIPLANLYDLSIGFAFGAAVTMLLIEHRPNTRFVGAIALPLICLVLILAIFIGNEIGHLQPVLDSYWRPIHVGDAMISYGIALVSFACAVMYLLKDGVKPEAMGIFTALFSVANFALFSKAFQFSSLSFRLTPMRPTESGTLAPISPLRVPLPGVGWFVFISMSLLLLSAICFALYVLREQEPLREQARRWGHIALRVSLVTQAVGLGVLFYQIKAVKNVGALIGTDQLHDLGKWLAGKEAATMPTEQLIQGANSWLQQSGGGFVMNMRSNPVELAALVTAFVLSLFIVLFSFNPERLRAGLPSLEKLDSLTYKTVGAAFAGLAILLVTGAIWANESWGKYWGWDPKETGALVAWIAYAAYLHTRIAHGWSGRKSAYFALLGFLLVIFTYLGVSYLLPGLHSYAE
jgi:ABC-type transport system involved in cytochrome c biogenesis permease subunit